MTQAKGRPIWADTEQSMQTIDMGKSLLSNTAVYQVGEAMNGWMEITLSLACMELMNGRWMDEWMETSPVWRAWDQFGCCRVEGC